MVNFFSNLNVGWNQLDAVNRTTVKLVVSAVITAIAFSAIALTLHFVAQGNPIAGWSMDALLLITALPGGIVAVAAQLLAAALMRPCSQYAIGLSEEQRQDIQRLTQNRNSSLNRHIDNASQSLTNWIDPETLNARSTVQSHYISLHDDIILNLFSNLDVLSLVRASQVCRQWYRKSQDDRLWKFPCFAESIPTEDLAYSTRSYKKKFYNYKMLANRISYNLEEESLLPLPNNSNETMIKIFFKTNNEKILLYRSGRFEIWNSFLTEKYSEQPAPNSTECVKETIKVIGQTGFLICNCLELEHRNKYIHISSFDIVNNQPLAKISFKQEEDLLSKTAFELNANTIFISREDGTIVVGNLELKKTLSDASRCIEVDVSRGKETEAFQKCVVLKGHTAKIHALHVVGSYLFSASADGTIKQWDFVAGVCVRTIVTHFFGGAASLEVSGRYVFGLSSAQFTICQWELETGWLIAKIELFKNCDAFHVVGNMLFCSFVKVPETGETADRFIEVYILNKVSNTHVEPVCIKRFKAIGSYPKCMQILDSSIYLLGRDHLYKWDFAAADKPAILPNT